jgi:hypothetical protein
MEVPNFLKLENNSLLFNLDNQTFVFYVPENYFKNESKVPIAEIQGQYVSMIGVCNWSIIDNKGKSSKLMPFNFPTMFLCKPSTIEKVKNLQLDNTEPSDYRLLKFKKGDEVVSQTRVPQLIDNVEILFKMAIMTGKLPTTIPYDKLWEIFMESAALNGFNYKLNAQLFCLLISYICRDPKDISKRFNETPMTDMTKYRPIDIRMVPKFISPYTAITSENWDEAMRAAIELSGKEDTPESPLEKIVTM